MTEQYAKANSDRLSVGIDHTLVHDNLGMNTKVKEKNYY